MLGLEYAETVKSPAVQATVDSSTYAVTMLRTPSVEVATPAPAPSAPAAAPLMAEMLDASVAEIVIAFVALMADLLETCASTMLPISLSTMDAPAAAPTAPAPPMAIELISAEDAASRPIVGALI